MSMDKQKVLEKVTKLLALANNPGANSNEASIALRQARTLMAQYNIESEELRAGQVAESSIRTGTRRSPADWLHSLAATCAAAFDCSHLSYYHHRWGTASSSWAKVLVQSWPPTPTAASPYNCKKPS